MTLTRDEKEFDDKLLAVIGEGGTEDLFKLKNLLEAIDHNITRSVPDNMLKIFQTRQSKSSLSTPANRMPTELYRGIADYLPKPISVNITKENNIGVPALIKAIEIGNEKMVDLLLKSGVNANPTFNRTESLALRKAVLSENRKINIINKLLDHGAKINSLVLNTACNKEVFEILVEKGGGLKILNTIGKDIHTKNISPVSVAAYAGSTKYLEALSEESGSDILYKKDNYGMTPLMNAASSGKFETVEYLFNKNAKRKLNILEERSSKGITPLMYATTAFYTPEKSLKTVEFLIKKGADINAVVDFKKNPIEMDEFNIYARENGKTALMHSSQYLNLAVTSFLVKQNGIKLNQKDLEDRTALDHALNQESFTASNDLKKEVAKILIRSGADVEQAKTKDSPLMQEVLSELSNEKKLARKAFKESLNESFQKFDQMKENHISKHIKTVISSTNDITVNPGLKTTNNRTKNPNYKS